MKAKEVIAILNDMKGVFGTRGHEQYSLPALDLAIETLEKQIGFHVFDISEGRGTWKDGYCKCGHYVTDGHTHCHNCGQKLDWEEMEEDYNG